MIDAIRAGQSLNTSGSDRDGALFGPGCLLSKIELGVRLLLNKEKSQLKISKKTGPDGLGPVPDPALDAIRLEGKVRCDWQKRQLFPMIFCGFRFRSVQ
jgi:hypothetical protein